MGLFDSIKKKISSAASSVGSALGFEKLRDGLAKTRTTFFDKLSVLVKGRTIDAQLLSEIEDILLGADVGVATTDRILEGVKQDVKQEKLSKAEDIIDALKSRIAEILSPSSEQLSDSPIPSTSESGQPHVMLVVGVNGVGKTTSIGKLAHNLKQSGKSVVIGAADTFRAAANEQLEVWASRAGVDIIQQRQGADPAAVAFDTLQSAIARKLDVCIIDTAGRLHNKQGLMQELEKISRVMRKLKASAPDEVLLVLDATTGQNAVQQAKEFSKVAAVSGIILTKLDGTAKGGVVIAISNELNIPVQYIGVGESINDLQRFDAISFVDALFGSHESVEDSFATAA